MSDKVFPLGEVNSMSEEDRDRLPANKEDQGSTLSKVERLAPLLKLALEFLELILRIFKVIN